MRTNSGQPKDFWLLVEKHWKEIIEGYPQFLNTLSREEAHRGFIEDMGHYFFYRMALLEAKCQVAVSELQVLIDQQRKKSVFRESDWSH